MDYWHVDSYPSAFSGLRINMSHNCSYDGDPSSVKIKTVSKRGIIAALSRLHVPSQYVEDITDKILWDAKNLPRNRRGKVKMTVSLELYDDVDIDSDEMVEEDMGTPRFEAGSESWISKLERVEVAELGSSSCQCSICLDDIIQVEGDQKEIRRMPCSQSHMYHGYCIVKWLKLSRYCPQCRYPVPAADDDEDQELKEAHQLNTVDKSV